MTSILSFDMVILSCIGQFCRPKDLCKLSKVNRQMYSVVGQPTKNKSDFVYFSEMWATNVIDSHGWDHGSSFIRSEGQMKPGPEKSFIMAWFSAMNAPLQTTNSPINKPYYDNDDNKPNYTVATLLTMRLIKEHDIVSILEFYAKTKLDLHVIMYCLFGWSIAHIFDDKRHWKIYHKDMHKYLPEHDIVNILTYTVYDNTHEHLLSCKSARTMTFNHFEKFPGVTKQKFIYGLGNDPMVHDILKAYPNMIHYINIEAWTPDELLSWHSYTDYLFKRVAINKKIYKEYLEAVIKKYTCNVYQFLKYGRASDREYYFNCLEYSHYFTSEQLKDMVFTYEHGSGCRAER